MPIKKKDLDSEKLSIGVVLIFQMPDGSLPVPISENLKRNV